MPTMQHGVVGLSLFFLDHEALLQGASGRAAAEHYCQHSGETQAERSKPGVITNWPAQQKSVQAG